MNLERRKIRQPGERRQILDEKIVDMAAVVAAPDGRGLNPVGTMLGRILLLEIFVIDAVRVALHRDRASAQMRKQRRRNARVIVDYLALRESCGREKNLVEIGQSKTLAFDFDDRRLGHAWIPRSPTVLNRCKYIFLTAIPCNQIRCLISMERG